MSKKMKIVLGLVSILLIGILLSTTNPWLLKGEMKFDNLDSYQKRKYWQYMTDCQSLLNNKKYTEYRTCALNALQKAGNSQVTAAYCTDSDGVDYFTKGVVKSDLYPNGKEDYVQTFSNGISYVMEGACNSSNQYVTYQKNCKELGNNYGAVDGACVVLTALDTYPNLQKVKSALENIKVLDNSTKKYINGKNLVTIILQNGYNGLSSIEDKEAFFKKQFDSYGIGTLAETNLIRQVVQSLWIENNKIVPWSIASYTEDQTLLLYPAFFDIQLNNGGSILPVIPVYSSEPWSSISDSKAVTIDFKNDTFDKTFILSHKLTAGASNQKEAILQITSWMEKNFMHANWKYGWEVYEKDNVPEKPAGANIFIPKNLSRFFEERIGGCHEPAFLMRGMLISLNIPAINFSLNAHGAVYLPTLDRYIHGDNIANFAVVPPEGLLLTEAEVTPMVTSKNGAEYDTPGATVQKKYSNMNYYFTNIADDRDGDSMYLWTDSVNFKIPSADWKTMSDQALPEYVLNYDQPNHIIESSYNKIQTLEELNK